jgi:hypothetical protein
METDINYTLSGMRSKSTFSEKVDFSNVSFNTKISTIGRSVFTVQLLYFLPLFLFNRKTNTLALGRGAWSSGIVSTCHRGVWSYGSWDRIPPGCGVVAFIKRLATPFTLAGFDLPTHNIQSPQANRPHSQALSAWCSGQRLRLRMIGSEDRWFDSRQGVRF